MKKQISAIANRARRVLGVVVAAALAVAMASPAALAATPESVRSVAYEAYYELLCEAVNEYGVGEGSSDNFLEGPNMFAPQGVLYARLIDFDNDGVSELVYTYLDGSWASLLYGEYCVVYGYSAGVEQYFMELQGAEGGGGSEFRVVTDRSGVSYLHAVYTDYTGYVEVADHRYYTVKNGVWSEVPGAWVDIVSEHPLSKDENTVSAVLGELLTSEKPDTWAQADIATAIAAGLVPETLQSGYTQATTRAEFCALAVMLYENVTGEAIIKRVSFTDTNDVNVEKAAAIGVVNGVGDGRFDPGGKLTREQAATMLSRLADALGKPLPKHPASFGDVGSVSPYATEAVGQMQASGVMGGVGGNTFSPKTDYQRQQSIVTILRLFVLVK